MWVRSRLDALGWRVIVAGDSEPFSKSRAIMRAVASCTDEHVVLHDADVWCDTTVQAAADLDAHEWSIPHLTVWRLSKAGTTRLIDGHAPTPEDCTERHRGVLGGGIVAVRRETLLRVPFDTRFIGWGGEDVSWGKAMQTLVGPPMRYANPVWHLWHPPAERKTRALPARPESERLLMRYVEANRNPEQMQTLVEGAREAQKEI